MTGASSVNIHCCQSRWVLLIFFWGHWTGLTSSFYCLFAKSRKYTMPNVTAQGWDRIGVLWLTWNPTERAETSDACDAHCFWCLSTLVACCLLQFQRYFNSFLSFVFVSLVLCTRVSFVVIFCCCQQKHRVGGDNTTKSTRSIYSRHSTRQHTTHSYKLSEQMMHTHSTNASYDTHCRLIVGHMLIVIQTT